MSIDPLQLVLFLCVMVTLTYGVTESVLLSIPRMLVAMQHQMLEALLYCALCSGFWCGALAGLVVLDGAPIERALLGAFLAPGLIALLRLFNPQFLPGAQHEREHLDRLRADVAVERDDAASEQHAADPESGSEDDDLDDDNDT